MLVIDGSEGEGGGQVLRSSLALSIVTGQPFRIENIRAKRSKPGLMRQHLTSVLAAREICDGGVDGATLGSTTLTFTPGPVRPGGYHFSVGTAGSANLVLQTVLPPLLLAGAPSRVVAEGGTHNPTCPPFDFLDRVFLPVLRAMGYRASLSLEAHGFYPAGGGRLVLDVEPADRFRALDLTARGALLERGAEAMIANLPTNIAHRELHALGRRLDLQESERQVVGVSSIGPGNALLYQARYEHVTALFAGFGERRVRAEQVAERLADEVLAWEATGGAVTPYLADQLLLPMALAAGGRFTTSEPTLHTTTNAAIVDKFTSCPVSITPRGGGAWQVGHDGPRAAAMRRLDMFTDQSKPPRASTSSKP